MNDNFKIDDSVEQAFRQGYEEGLRDAKERIAETRLEDIAHHYGYDKQREQFIEECSEAILAVQKCKRHGSKGNFVDLC